jgi:RimJ/RimL family protein N-acetyltransferase
MESQVRSRAPSPPRHARRPSHSKLPPGSEIALSRDGTPLLVRAIRPTDRQALAENFDHLSEETRYRRFLAPIKRLTERDLAYLTDVDHRDHEALIALTAIGEIVGVARYIRLDARPATAEVAVTVADDWQRGIGTMLLRRLAVRARANGVTCFLGICLSRNADMIGMLRHLGPERPTRGDDPAIVEIEVEIPADPDSAELRSAVRRAATGPRLH